MAKIKKGSTKRLLEQFADVQQEPEADLPDWEPSLSGTQKKIFDSQAKYILAYGERGTGKTYVSGGHKLVRHAYENFNALCLIVVGVRSQATMGGVWHKLLTEICPLWQDGLDIHITDERQDTQKNLYMDVENRYGGYSRIVLISVPYGAFIKDRIKGFEPSYVFVDELTNLDTPDYFTAVVQQLGRRPGIATPQQYVAACNPDGPSHWVYKRFFEQPLATGKWNEDYAKFHVPISENVDNLPKGYYERVLEAVSNDPIEEARMIRGEWVDRPLGAAIFKPYFIDSIHMRGDKKKGIIPLPDYPIVVGWDPGAVNNAIIFEQIIPAADKTVWIVFDEVVHVNEHIPYTQLVVEIMRRMRYWNRVTDSDLTYIHISDNSAFNQYRAATGSYDVRDIEAISRGKADNFELDPIRMKAAPKFSGSVESRVRLTIAKLQKEELLISAPCKNVRKVFFNLISEKEGRTYDPTRAFKPRRSTYLHAFDAMTYPFLYYDAGPSRIHSSRAKSEIIEIGA
jgi:hypothetical protein